ncbi:MAG TPA: ABC transporter substrate-binding protein [Gaiellaceae bacterium]|nr:ABC transporter substrate-binding protein [Gaiellaceae bacterium]
MAAGSTATAHKTVTITFMEAMSSGKQKPALDLLTQRFERTHPGITVNLIAEPNYGVLQQKEQAAVAAGDPPTIGQAYENWAAAFADAKAIMPLDSYVNGTNGLTKAQQKQFWKGVWKDLYLPDGKIWMWPFNKSDYVMYYNADKLQKAGLAVPKTWVDFAKVAKAVTKNGDWAWSTDTGTLAAPADGGIMWMAITRAFGGTWVVDGKPTLNSKGGVKAMEFLKDLKNHGALQIGTNYPGETALGAGRSAFDLSTIAGYPYELGAVGGKFTMKVAELPTGRNGEGNSMQGTNVVLFSHASLAQRAAAWEFMKFLTEPRQTAYWSEETGYLPVTQAALPAMKGFIKTHPYAQVAAQSLQVARGNPPYAWWTTAIGEVSTALQAVLDNGADPKAALDEAQAKAMAAVNGG